MSLKTALRKVLFPEPTEEELLGQRKRARIERLAVEQRLAIQRLVYGMVRDVWDSEKSKPRWDLPSASELRAAEADPVVMTALKERYADTELHLEDLDWIRLGGATSGLDLPDSVRRDLVRRSRQYFMYNYPLMTRTITLYTWYAFGREVEFSSDEEAAQKVIEEFVSDPSNRVLMDDDGQEGMSNRWQVDGESYPVHFLGKKAPWITLRYVDCLQITEIKSKDDDPLTPLWYKREWNDGKENLTRWYADYRADEEDLAGTKPDKDVANPKDVTMGHWKLLGLGQRGLGRAFACLEWLHEHKRFMERRITISIASSMIAWLTKYEGTPAQGDLLKDSWGVAADSDDPQLPPVAGTRFIENAKATTSWMETDTNAAGAKIDEEMFVRWIAAGLGINPIILGWDVARWATAVAMDDPIIVSFINYQQRWESNFRNLLEYVLKVAGVEKTGTITIGFPQIKVADKKTDLEALAVGQAIVGAYPVLSMEVMQQALMAMGIQDVAGLIDKVKKEQEEVDDEENNPDLSKAMDDGAVDELVAVLAGRRVELEEAFFGGGG